MRLSMTQGSLERLIADVDSADRPIAMTLQDLCSRLYPGQGVNEASVISIRIDLRLAGLGVTQHGSSPTSEVRLFRVGPPISPAEMYAAGQTLKEGPTPTTSQVPVTAPASRPASPAPPQTGTPPATDSIALAAVPLCDDLTVRPVVSTRWSPDSAVEFGGALLRRIPGLLEVEFRVEDRALFAYLGWPDDESSTEGVAAVNLTSQLDGARVALSRVAQEPGLRTNPAVLQFTVDCPHVLALLMGGSTQVNGLDLSTVVNPDANGRPNTLVYAAGTVPGDYVTAQHLEWAAGTGVAAWQVALQWAAFVQTEPGREFTNLVQMHGGPGLSGVADFVSDLGRIARGALDIVEVFTG